MTTRDDLEGLPFWQQATVLGHDRGRMTNVGAVDDLTGLIIEPDSQEPDPAKNETRCPAFKEHPIPPAAQMLWLLARNAGTPPPWRVRVSPSFCAAYSMRRIALALAPHAQILMTVDGRSPAPMMNPEKLIEFNVTDQVGRRDDAPIGQRLILPGQV